MRDHRAARREERSGDQQRHRHRVLVAEGCRPLQAQEQAELEAERQYVRAKERKKLASIKKVLPALVPELGYADLEIGSGDLASLSFAPPSQKSSTGVRAMGAFYMMPPSGIRIPARWARNMKTHPMPIATRM